LVRQFGKVNYGIRFSELCLLPEHLLAIIRETRPLLGKSTQLVPLRCIPRFTRHGAAFFSVFSVRFNLLHAAPPLAGPQLQAHCREIGSITGSATVRRRCALASLFIQV